ncbi:Bromodomain-containing protein, partial [Aureobasidium pullulans EXF-150]
GPFLRPVDEVRDNAPGYYARIRQPMDLATMRTKLEGGRYNAAADFKADFDLMISNCYEYNTAGPASLTDLAERFVKDFDWEWEQMARWRSKERSRLLKLQQPPPAPSAIAQSSVSSGSNVSMKEAELLFCQHILQEFIRPKHKRYVPFFKEPVDAARVPSYHTIIKKPIDLATITTKLENQQYDSAATFKADFDLMFNNSDHFNA